MTLKARIRAVDRFIKGCKEDGIYDDLQAACVMAGWDSLAGALTPLKGAAPTNNGFLAADFDRGIGLKGNGSSKYLNANISPDDLASASDVHLSYSGTGLEATSGNHIAVHTDGETTDQRRLFSADVYADYVSGRSARFSTYTAGQFPVVTSPSRTEQHFIGTRTSTSLAKIYQSGVETASNTTSVAILSHNRPFYIFAANKPTVTAHTSGTLSFYSIGNGLDALQAAAFSQHVSTLMADLRAIEEVGFDRDAIAYIRAVEEADDAYLETSVKVAINNLVSGLKADGLWDAIGASCLLCGPRTLAGALVPLRGDAPTAYGFVEGDYDREGLTGDGTSYLDSNRAANLTSDSDLHFACYLSTSISDNSSPMGVSSAANNASFLRFASTVYTWCNSPSGSAANALQVNNSGAAGFYGATRTTDLEFFCRNAGTAQTKTAGAGSLPSSNYYIFADNGASGIRQVSTSSISFYSIGAGLTGDSAGLAKLDSHVTAYVTAIGAAI